MTLDARALAGLQASFIEESAEGLDRAEASLLELEREPGQEQIDDVFRAIHSIKGGAGAFGIDELIDLAHQMESLLDDLRRGAVATPAICRALLDGVDALRRTLAARAAGQPPCTRGHAELCTTLAALRARPAAAPTAPRMDDRGALWHVAFSPFPELTRRGNDPLMIVLELAAHGGVVREVDTSRVPPLDELEPTEMFLAWKLVVPGSVARADIDEAFAWVDGDCALVIERVEPAAPAAPARVEAPVAVAPAVEHAPAQKSVRVGVDKIDLLMNMVGELVITQSMLGELDHDGTLAADRIERLREGLSLLARNTRALQESVVRLRSMPISTVFGRLPRLVHDLGERLGKEVALDLVGQSTELDKTVLDKIGDPLVHLIRNSIDHGLEGPADREAAGKPRCGTVSVHAAHRGSAIVIDISDDGRGLDHARIREVACARGIIAADAQLSPDEIAQLIFAPGFSTASAVSEVSGRGVGMDVVYRTVKELGGEVRVQSTPGRGTCTTLRLPLTLAIIDGQLVRLGEQVYVVPLLSIVETVLVDPARRKRIANCSEVYRVRDEIVPVVDLAAVFGLTREVDSKLLMIVEADGERIALVVDELLAQQQVVIKSLETNYGRIEGLAGATILGDGRVAFIIDIVALARDVLRKSRAA